MSTSGKGDLVVGGLELGNVFIGVQPLLGLEGDPMRLMFERDLTPHPQYAAFYQWLRGEQGFGAQVRSPHGASRSMYLPRVRSV